MSKNKLVSPVLKWVGGKRQLLPSIKLMLPKRITSYCEPFVGGGAVLFDILSKYDLEEVYISDINAELINTYRIIRDDIDVLIEMLCAMQNDFIPLNTDERKAYYMEKRERFNDFKVNGDESINIEKAALMVFLNKTCFNGLFRVNKKGLFNVPYNNSRRSSVDESLIMEVSEYLQGITIMNGDFQEISASAKKGDFIFLDSPYAPLNPTSFESYTKEGFDIESHRRLSKFYDELTAKGCYCMLTNHNTELINELYGNKGYKIDVVSVKRMINSDASNRVGEEVIICNY